MLRALELTIRDTYQHKPDLTDHNVRKVLDSHINVLQAEIKDRKPREVRLSAVERELHRALKQVVWLFLGRDPATPSPQPVTREEMLACLKRIQRSVDQMSKQGRQGYVHFIDSFFTS